MMNFNNALLVSNDPLLNMVLRSTDDILGGDPSQRATDMMELFAAYINDFSKSIDDRFIALLRYDWLDGSYTETIEQYNEYLERYSNADAAKRAMVQFFIDTVDI